MNMALNETTALAAPMDFQDLEDTIMAMDVKSVSSTKSVASTASHSRAVPAGPYERIPSPPFMAVPFNDRPEFADSNDLSESGVPLRRLSPSHQHIHTMGLTPSEADIVTRNEPVVTEDKTPWSYSRRRTAQQILPYLYLGPTSVLRDWQYLQRENITMAVIARTAMMKSHRNMSAEQVQSQLGVRVEYIDLAATNDLVRAFPAMVKLINGHMLDMHNTQVQALAQRGQAADISTLRRGKVLVMCESGNDRSAALVMGYVMTMFACGVFTAIRFVGCLRFCCSLTEEVKRTLLTWGDILNAQTDVANDRQRQENEIDRIYLENSAAIDAQSNPERSKRGIDDTQDIEDDTETDHDRFSGRARFVPFIDKQ